jgi:hypothetical protein
VFLQDLVDLRKRNKEQATSVLQKDAVVTINQLVKVF